VVVVVVVEDEEDQEQQAWLETTRTRTFNVSYWVDRFRFEHTGAGAREMRYGQSCKTRGRRAPRSLCACHPAARYLRPSSPERTLIGVLLPHQPLAPHHAGNADRRYSSRVYACTALVSNTSPPHHRQAPRLDDSRQNARAHTQIQIQIQIREDTHTYTCWSSSQFRKRL